MKTYVLMTKMANPEARIVEVGAKLRQRDNNSRSWRDQVLKLCPEVSFKAHFALLGYWDFMDIYEAPDDDVAAMVSMISRKYGAHQVESWPAIPCERLQELVDEIEQMS